MAAKEKANRSDLHRATTPNDSPSGVQAMQRSGSVLPSVHRPEVVGVTGASAGVSRAVGRRFAREGAAIGLLARGLDGLEGARRDVETLGGKAIVWQADAALWKRKR